MFLCVMHLYVTLVLQTQTDVVFHCPIGDVGAV